MVNFMNKQTRENEIKDFLGILYSCTYMPMHYYVDNRLSACYPNYALPQTISDTFRDIVTNSTESYDYKVTAENLYIGIIKNCNWQEEIVIGPIFPSFFTREDFQKICIAYSFDEKNMEAFEEYVHRTPSFNPNQFLNILSMLHHECNGSYINIIENNLSSVAEVEKQIQKEHTSSLMERKEHENYHDTYFFEQEYYGYVERGDVDGLLNFFKKVPPYTEGSVAADYIRQAKNIFIATITLLTRHAIAGGLDIETAYQLSDSYIQEIEKMSNTAAITQLSGTAVFDFTKRVADAKIPKGMSLEIFKCIQYISNHINQPISVDRIAHSLNMDRSTLSKKFKRELGFNISSYIMRRKLEEAKSLLRYTDKSISEISEYLCFSSQSYFQNVFKKKYGMTPNEFRK